MAYSRKECIRDCYEIYHSQMRFIRDNWGPGTYDYDNGNRVTIAEYERRHAEEETKLHRCMQKCQIQYPE